MLIGIFRGKSCRLLERCPDRHEFAFLVVEVLEIEVLHDARNPPVDVFLDEVSVSTIGEEFLGWPGCNLEHQDTVGEGLQVRQNIV